MVLGGLSQAVGAAGAVVRRAQALVPSLQYASPPALGLLRLPVEIDRLRGSSTRPAADAGALVRSVEGGPDRVAFLCPRKRYFFRPPKAMVASGRERVTAPFDAFWCLHLGPPKRQRSIVAGAAKALNKEEGGGAEEGEGGVRLGVGFKKRRGTPGYHTVLDEHGLLIGRPAPSGWLSKASDGSNADG